MKFNIESVFLAHIDLPSLIVDAITHVCISTDMCVKVNSLSLSGLKIYWIYIWIYFIKLRDLNDKYGIHVRTYIHFQALLSTAT